jgi:4a-hydroxytetrahydrobiopterin dehydratase
VPKLLSDDEVRKRLRKLDGWSYDDGFVTKKFEFKKFMQGIDFVNQLAALAEKEEHHPDIHVRYTTVTLSVQTHSEGGVTDWDIELAAAIDRIPLKGLSSGK